VVIYTHNIEGKIKNGELKWIQQYNKVRGFTDNRSEVIKEVQKALSDSMQAKEDKSCL